jgi:hypothetical protein
MLSFKSLALDKKPELYTIDDGAGTTIDVPKKGHVTVLETIAYETIMMSADESNARKMAEFAAKFLEMRKNEEVPESEWSEWPFSFVRAVVSFFSNEQNHWNPLPDLNEFVEEDSKPEKPRSRGTTSTGS